MFLDVNYLNIIYTCIFLICFCLSYFIILGTRLEVIFKKGSTWQIRLLQVFFAIIVSYFVTEGLFALINKTQF